MFSLTRPGPTTYDRSAPDTASLYVTVSPSAAGASLPAPFRPRVTVWPSASKHSSRSASEPNQLLAAFVVLEKAKPLAVDGTIVGSMSFQDLPARYPVGTADTSACTRP